MRANRSFDMDAQGRPRLRRSSPSGAGQLQRSAALGRAVRRETLVGSGAIRPEC
jgi:hypothetical protein